MVIKQLYEHSKKPHGCTEWQQLTRAAFLPFFTLTGLMSGEVGKCFHMQKYVKGHFCVQLGQIEEAKWDLHCEGDWYNKFTSTSAVQVYNSGKKLCVCAYFCSSHESAHDFMHLAPAHSENRIIFLNHSWTTELKHGYALPTCQCMVSNPPHSLTRPRRQAENGSAANPSNLSYSVKSLNFQGVWFKIWPKSGGEKSPFHKMHLTHWDRAVHCRCRECVHEQNEKTLMTPELLWWSNNYRWLSWGSWKTERDRFCYCMLNITEGRSNSWALRQSAFC